MSEIKYIPKFSFTIEMKLSFEAAQIEDKTVYHDESTTLFFVKNWHHKALILNEKLVVVYDKDFVPHIFSLEPQHHTLRSVTDYFELATPNT
jgi:hypothetical protein